MHVSSLSQNEPLKSVRGTEGADGSSLYYEHGYKGVTEIRVGQLRGPMGFYDVAIVKFDESPEEIIPLHMLESIDAKIKA